ncbi:hypothetical protein [Nonomuraea phyllanthi]|uniref:hypothetical protein n=1 Tax=Nonomuraea phyllanthi TaxID=2219224 RepID=UPI001D147097|nr:hypothetical protein [Nonomuraea phyllanthi]
MRIGARADVPMFTHRRGRGNGRWADVAADVADILADIAAAGPQGCHVGVAGPEPQDLVGMARRTNQARGSEVRLPPTTFDQ